MSFDFFRNVFDHVQIGCSDWPESVRFYTRQKAVTQRWPASVRGGAEFHMPTTK